MGLYGIEVYRVIPTIILDDVLAWAIARKEAETKHRPDINIHKRTLVETWDQTIKKLSEVVKNIGSWEYDYEGGEAKVIR